MVKLPFEIICISYYIFNSIGWSYLSSVAVLLTVSGVIQKYKGYFVQLAKDLNEKKDLGTFADKDDEATVKIDSIPGHGSKVYKFKLIK